jgi:GlcNAc-P-P-Und epimerase
MSIQRALVTGGSGFVGTHLVAALLASQGGVLNLDVVAPKLPKHGQWWRRLDILDEASLRETVEQYNPTVIYNLAAVADISKTGEELTANTRGLTNVINANLALPSPALLIHTSTQFVVAPQYYPKHIRDYAPYSEYGASKAQSEELLWQAPTHMPWTIVRPTTVWGSWHPTFARSIWCYLRKRWYLLPTGIDPIRSYGYVGNVVAQLLAIPTASKHAIDKMIFYVGDQPIRSSVWLDGFSRALTGKPVRRVPGSWLRLAALAGELSGRLGGPSPINLERFYRMTTDYETPMTTTFEVLGHGPFSFRDGIEITTSWLASYE